MRGVKFLCHSPPHCMNNVEFQAKGGALVLRLLHKTSVTWLTPKDTVFHSLVHV